MPTGVASVAEALVRQPDPSESRNLLLTGPGVPLQMWESAIGQYQTHDLWGGKIPSARTTSTFALLQPLSAYHAL
jgi:hypothetical protein